MHKNNLSILIVSCDQYCDLWAPAIKLFEIEWPDCPFDIYLGSNFKQVEHNYIKSITIGEDLSWSSNVHKMLEKIESEYVIMLLEDFFLTERAKTQKIIEILDWVKSNDIDCCRLIKNNFTHGNLMGTVDQNSIFEIAPHTPYRICTQAAIWNKSFLMALLNPKYSAWYFEGANSRLINYINAKIASVSEPVLFYKHAVERGKWISQGITNLQRHGIEIDLSVRGIYKINSIKPENDKSKSLPARALGFALFIKYLPDLITLWFKVQKIR